MALNDLWKKFISENDDGGEEESSYYRPRQKAGTPTLVDEPDDDIFRSPKAKTTGPRLTKANDYDTMLDDEDAQLPF